MRINCQLENELIEKLGVLLDEFIYHPDELFFEVRKERKECALCFDGLSMTRENILIVEFIFLNISANIQINAT